jgi:tetratricopeptide (TPR) repeat protein
MRHDQTINRGPGEGKAGDRTLPPPWAIPWSLAALLVAAALFRAVYFYLYARHSIFFDGLILDSRVYDSWAEAIARGQWIGRQAFYFPPLYPYLLGLLFKAVGHSLAPVYLLQALLGLVNIVLIYRIGLATFNERVALLAAGAAALYGPFAFFEMKVLGTTLGLTLSLLALVLLVGAERASQAGRRGAGRWLPAGLVIGLAAECVPGTLLLAPMYAAYLGFARYRAAMALLAGAFLATVPVLAHNLYVASDPLPLSGQGGLTFYQGNNPNASGLYSLPPGFSGSPESQAVEEQSQAERETGRAMRRSEISAHFLRKGLAFIAASPVAWLRLEVRKLLALLGDYEASTEYSLYFERQQIPWLRILCLPFAAIVAAGTAGMILAGRPRPPAAAVLVYAAHAAAIPLIFYVSGRYRLPLAPPLLIYGAVFCDRVLSEIRATGALTPTAAKTAALALGLALVSFFPLGSQVVPSEANVHYNIGNLLMERNQYEAAIASFDRSLAQWPGNDYAWINRGNSLDKLGRPDEALVSYRRAEEVNPGSWRAYKAQGIILHRDKRYEDEAAVYRRGLLTDGEEAYYFLGVALKNLNRLDEAISTLQQALRLNPAYARAHTRLGEILAARGDSAAARDEFRKALQFDPADTAARTELGRLGG